ncbi:adenylate/guanylate cyclase domain-containing protein [Bradyrhizobium acaciae]|uniref:adenylate/guanylate cyclase domain-containing protein n=1 Tax=Bradyrhizobium acaciae TaxID=2683706 RepID=UPI001E444155|nr:adenylate/guanylate cyclase domain-containing protein [Bradyrhizobium acaciae]MCC8977559.1 AAA family ATPase [Bradyrhizobium acaciae]
MDVGGWLRRLGLERYETAFREHEVSGEVLPSLTQEDLKEIGVGPVGHRRILLEAISALKANAGRGDSSADVAPTSNALSARTEDRAERRQVTVMFSDLVGSTALSARLDPEDLREVITAYQKMVAETVGRFGGFVAKYMGDGVLVYFGYPQAHEDDAERAVRAGLALVAAITNVKTHAALQTRIGIATGVVVVGDLIGSGPSQEQAIVGDTPNLAARLQGLAKPNRVVLADSTRRLVGSLFELEDLGPQKLKGISGPTPAWAALRLAAVEGRFEAMHASGLTDLVGREEEFDLLLRRWSRAESGLGHVVLLSGEPGIGKSRLTAALLEHLANGPPTRLRYFCSPQHTESALYPLIGQMERAAGLGHNDKPLAKLDKFDAMLAQSSTSPQDAALLAEMLSLPNDGRYPALDSAPEQRREKTLQALTLQIAELARRQPVLMIFEDAHWADPTSLEAIGRMVDRITTLPVLLIVTFRPEFNAPWVGQSHVTSLTLNRLGDSDAATIIARLVGNKTLPADVLAEIVGRTDGIPLFVEEMTKAVLEAESEGAARRTVGVVPSSVLAVPASLHASLMARLDRLGPAKEVAQIGSAIGRGFSHALLAAVAPKSETELISALDGLVQAGLLFRQGDPPQTDYLFKHALVRDAAYGTLLRGTRRTLHSRIADVLEQDPPNSVSTPPEVLAHHYTEAGAIEKAAALWGEAGRRSRARSALAEAEVHLRRALGQIATLPATAALRREQIALQVELVTVLMHTKGYGAAETKTAAERARALIEQAEAIGEPPEDPLLLFSVIYGFWVLNVAGFNGDAARELATQFWQLAARQASSGPILLARRMMGMTLMSVGSPVEAKEHLDSALEMYNAAEHGGLAAHFGTDARVAILEWRSRTLWLLGYPDAARGDALRSFACAREIDQAATLMHALAHSTATLILCGDVDEARLSAAELVALAESKGSSYWSANGRIWEGCLLTLAGRPSKAVEMLTSALDDYRATGATIYVPFAMSYLAAAYARLGRHQHALDAIDNALAMAQSTDERWCEAELYRIKGELTLALPDADQAAAQALFEQALAIARLQQARSWELRAATNIAQLLRDRGERQAACERLAPVYELFTQGFDTPDLQKTKALLDTLE